MSTRAVEPAAVQTSKRAKTVLILGVVGVALFFTLWANFVLAIIALSLAPGARREIEESQGQLAGLDKVKAGVNCAWVAIAIVPVIVAGFVIVVLAISLVTGTAPV